ncbi:hypothetical protein [Colwellia sp. 12G3]|uniref:hypothetical protein n=1 Tax=Colwellia sp. 12G3 TaxID=2058299 RepID=UPI000C329E20|nr:hypothetical protein [Colwellia sp. 12G3]PKI18208.1 hypothetical protein CXF71_00340 [Colwellia sp. 12G3]
MKLTYYFALIFSLVSSCSFVLANEQESLLRSKADVLQSRLNTMMQNSASWLDNIGAEESEGASAHGYLQFSWLPRTADLDDIDTKFKVSLNLPQWNERLALVIDNDDEDELLLDYETDYTSVPQQGVNVAFQYIKSFSDEHQIKNRIGVSRKQFYLRSEMQFEWQVNQLRWRLQPRIDYFLQDGWGPSVKGAVSYQLESSYFSLSASWQKIQNEARSRRKVGFFHIKSTGRDQLLVSGVQYNKSNNKEDIANESYFISTRYRNLIYKKWMYVEVEPFIELNQLNDFRREVGIGLSLISYYGE